ncbi:MAG: class I SAM-dependent methyltransferase [Treponema sp.]|jgi:SAM-dependent methyltransferase|nr:class I SAM-dependent methyltransferase [Treponema sp.]
MIKTWSTPVVPEETAPVPCALCGGRRFKPKFFCGSFSYVRCVRCGLVQINPQPSGGAVRGRYREGRGDDYLAYELANEKSFLALQELSLADAGFGELEGELLRRAAAGGRKAGVLDIGCATGALLGVLRGRGWDCRGVEISPAAEYARRERALEVSRLPLEENHFQDDAFDLALASHLIEHLNEPAGLAREVYRVLRPGGRFMVTTPNIAGFQARLFGGRWRSAIFDHLYLFSARTLGALLEGAGFYVEKTVTWGGLAAGTAPAFLKGPADRWAKRFGFGDVMLLRARKPDL